MATSKKKKFLEKHPTCCFCGGGKEAVEIDHTPAKIFFASKLWPEGYEFPACYDCNHLPSDYENLVALISKFSPPTSDDASEFKKFQKMLFSLKERHPEFAQEIMPSPKDKRTFLRANRIARPEGTFLKDIPIPILSIGGEGFKEAATAFGRKMFLALHYKHTGNIVPQDGRIIFRWDNQPTLEAILKSGNFGLPNNKAKIMRGKNDLSSDFDYLYKCEEKASYFLINIRNLLFFTGFVYEDPPFQDFQRFEGVYTVAPPFENGG